MLNRWKFLDFLSHSHFAQSTESPRFHFTASSRPYITAYGIKKILKLFHFVKVLEHISLYKLRLIISKGCAIQTNAWFSKQCLVDIKTIRARKPAASRLMRMCVMSLFIFSTFCSRWREKSFERVPLSAGRWHLFRMSLLTGWSPLNDHNLNIDLPSNEARPKAWMSWALRRKTVGICWTTGSKRVRSTWLQYLAFLFTRA